MKRQKWRNRLEEDISNIYTYIYSNNYMYSYPVYGFIYIQLYPVIKSYKTVQGYFN